MGIENSRAVDLVRYEGASARSPEFFRALPPSADTRFLAAKMSLLMFTYKSSMLTGLTR